MANYRLRVEGLLGGERPWSIGWAATATGTTDQVATLLHDAWNTLWGTTTNGLKNFVNAEVTTTQVTAAAQTATWGQTQKVIKTLALAGINSHDSLPWDSSVTISQSSALDAKTGRGRVELPCLSNDNLVSHIYLDATLTSLEIVFAAFWVTMTGSYSLLPGVFNRKKLKDGSPPFSFKPLILGVPSDKPGTVRARTRKVIPVKTHTFAMG